MATSIVGKQVKWDLTRDEDGHRTYTVQFKIKSDTGLDGPANVLQTPGLPVYGEIWEFDDDVDVWAWCRWNATVKPMYDGEICLYWTVDLLFTTKPNNCCRTSQIEDPLLQPMEISGGSSRYTEEATADRFGDKITTSSLEQVRGPQNEWDANRGSVKIKQYVADLQLALCESMRDTVNDEELWGNGKRKVKMTSFTWEQKFYGDCNVYYIRNFEFEINSETWDRNLLDEGSKALNGHHSVITGTWLLDDINGEPPDPTNPLHFKAYQDRAGNTTRVILDGHGKPYVPTVPAPEDQWWAVPCDGHYETFQGTCEEAREFAIKFGCLLSGPFSTYEAALAAAGAADALDEATDPYDSECPEENRPGKIHIEKYGESDFLLLGIPEDIG